jgi:hypothetical protein
MTITVPKMRQNDEALRLLAQMYARWFMRASARAVLDVCERIRDALYTATSQQDAYEQLAQLAESASDSQRDYKRAYERARDIVTHVIQAGGDADTLIVGQTDGYRHLCLSCSQDEQNFQRVRFFQMQERRFLLKPEVVGEKRSAYGRCQLCLQPINPNLLVLFTFAGTEKHPNACQCGSCNRAGIASLLIIYECCDKETQQVLFPPLRTVAAPSKQRCVEQAVEVCWEKGWYMFNKDTVLP